MTLGDDGFLCRERGGGDDWVLAARRRAVEPPVARWEHERGQAQRMAGVEPLAIPAVRP